MRLRNKLLCFIVLFFLEPECSLFYRTYFIEMDNITELRGILIKHRNSIPWESISHISLRKGILGRMLKYGDILVSPISGVETDLIRLKGIENPEKINEIMKERMKEVSRR